MKVAVIDLGTNTFHLLIASVSKASHEIIHRERIAVKIGEKGINKGQLTPDAFNRALATLKDFKDTIDTHEVEQTFATATSAIRNANNGTELVEAIKNQTGISVEIISGTREAELIHLGASKALVFGEEKSLIMDIGGGSIEFIIADQNQRYWMKSFEVGGQRLVERFHKSDPIAPKEIKALHAYFDSELSELFVACQSFAPNTLIGCSGTFDTLSDIYCEQNQINRSDEDTEYPLGKNAFDEIYSQLITKNRAERLKIPGMIEMRVDMIVVACILVDYLMQKNGLQNIRVSAYALKEGILHNVLEHLQLVNTSK